MLTCEGPVVIQPFMVNTLRHVVTFSSKVRFLHTQWVVGIHIKPGRINAAKVGETFEKEQQPMDASL